MSGGGILITTASYIPNLGILFEVLIFHWLKSNFPLIYNVLSIIQLRLTRSFQGESFWLARDDQIMARTRKCGGNRVECGHNYILRVYEDIFDPERALLMEFMVVP